MVAEFLGLARKRSLTPGNDVTMFAITSFPKSLKFSIGPILTLHCLKRTKSAYGFSVFS